MRKLGAIAFDIDGTLTDHNSWFSFTEELGGSKAEHMAIYEMLVLGAIELDDAKEQLVSMWGKEGRANKQSIIEMYKKWSVRKDAYPLFEWISTNNIPVCLITGATKQYAEVIATELGVVDYYASSELVFDSNNNLTSFNYEVDQSGAKERHFAEFCEKYSVSIEDCVPVGDSSNDIGIFQLTGNGILLDIDSSAKQPLKDSAANIVGSLTEALKLLKSLY